VYICDECVDICNDILGKPKAPASGEIPALEVFESRHFGPLVRCRLCLTVFAKEQCLAIPNRGWLCSGCLDAVRLQVVGARTERQS
jgi:hypothetical protein